jgi:hypothetical protein
VAVDKPDQLQVLEDDRGQVWVLRTRDARLNLLAADSGAVEGTWDLSGLDWLVGGGRVRPQQWSLHIADGAAWVGPYKLDLDTHAIGDKPGLLAERVLGVGPQGWAVADETAYGWEDDDRELVDEVYGGGVWIGWDDISQSAVIARFAKGTVERWVYE